MTLLQRIHCHPRFAVAGRITVSIALLIFISKRFDVDAITSHMAACTLPLYAFAFLLIISGVCISSFKWYLLLSYTRVAATYHTLVKWYYIGVFFNSFLPTVVGGDIVRIGLFGKAKNNMSAGAITVVMERILGLFALFAIAIASFVIHFDLFSNTSIYSIMIVVMAIEVGVGLVLLFPLLVRPVYRGISIVCTAYGLSRLRRFCRKTYGFLLIIHKDRTRIVWILLLSVVYHFISIMIYAVVSTSLGLGIPWTHFFTIVPLVMVFAMLPISFNGVGLRECASVYLYGVLNIHSTKAIALSVMTFMLILGNALIGGIIFAIDSIVSSSPKRCTTAQRY